MSEEKETLTNDEKNQDNELDINDEETQTEDNNQESKIQELKEENTKLIDRLQRNMAEFDNFRKRTVKEKSNMYDKGIMDTIDKIIPSIDNFERALDQMSMYKEDEKIKPILSGIEMIKNHILDSMKEIDVNQIECVGKEFDTNLHSAVSHIEDEKYGENEVIEEFQKGYMYKEKVIRHSAVKVAN